MLETLHLKHLNTNCTYKKHYELNWNLHKIILITSVLYFVMSLLVLNLQHPIVYCVPLSFIYLFHFFTHHFILYISGDFYVLVVYHWIIIFQGGFRVFFSKYAENVFDSQWSSLEQKIFYEFLANLSKMCMARKYWPSINIFS